MPHQTWVQILLYDFKYLSVLIVFAWSKVLTLPIWHYKQDQANAQDLKTYLSVPTQLFLPHCRFILAKTLRQALHFLSHAQAHAHTHNLTEHAFFCGDNVRASQQQRLVSVLWTCPTLKQQVCAKRDKSFCLHHWMTATVTHPWFPNQSKWEALPFNKPKLAGYWAHGQHKWTRKSKWFSNLVWQRQTSKWHINCSRKTHQLTCWFQQT